MATDYASLRVPELKKLLAEKGLSQAGNKADLVARLQENDNKDAPADANPAAVENKDDEINYSDDEAKPADAPAPAAATTDAAAPEAAAPAAAEPAAESKVDETIPAEEGTAAPVPNFAIGLSSTLADEEAKKRADRAKRFGIEEDDNAKKRADRAARFGIDEKELASGLDSALPDRPLKRGRGRDNAEGNRPGKRQSTDGRDPRRSGRNRGGPAPAAGKGGSQPKKSSFMDDPAEKAKAEKRAARFATS
jgi:SAP domain-containing ribonucleoprotein